LPRLNPDVIFGSEPVGPVLNAPSPAEPNTVEVADPRS
jgi:hypothetical protein